MHQVCSIMFGVLASQLLEHNKNGGLIRIHLFFYSKSVKKCSNNVFSSLNEDTLN